MKCTISRMSRLIGWVIIGVAGLAAGGDAQQVAPPGPVLPGGTGSGEASILIRRQYQPADLAKPRPVAIGRSRYRTLLRRIEVPADRTTYGDFYDYGLWQGTSYAGQNDLPLGYWVYLAPDWYIFKEDVSVTSASQPEPRPWGPEQATGAPDTWPKSG